MKQIENRLTTTTGCKIKLELRTRTDQVVYVRVTFQPAGYWSEMLDVLYTNGFGRERVEFRHSSGGRDGKVTLPEGQVALNYAEAAQWAAAVTKELERRMNGDAVDNLALKREPILDLLPDDISIAEVEIQT